LSAIIFKEKKDKASFSRKNKSQLLISSLKYVSNYFQGKERQSINFKEKEKQS
jgi:hypothetical protein